MTSEQSHYMTIQVLFDGLDRLLNQLEEMAHGCYEIISIVSLHTPSINRAVVGVVIKFHLREDVDIPFDEAEIRRKLGFED